MSGRLADITGPDVSEKIGDNSVILLPVGAIEQHGPHLPMSVDTVIAEETSNALLDSVGSEIDLWLLPTLSISKSNEHTWSPGTLSYGTATMLSILDDIARCISTTAAKRLVLLNGHGGNTALLITACRDIRVAHGLLTFLVHPSLPPASGGTSTKEELGMGIHGGLNETSVFSYLRPGEVRMEKALRRVPEWMADNKWVKFGGNVQFGWTSRDFGAEGLIGDPTDANPELGKELFEAAVDSLADQLREISSFDFQDR
ncbi:MAG: creatininase family protein [Acidimicrobiales bacterium]|jgi:creatinine amidohydrolase|nr:creatinine amidohydrolase [Acidimicrobiaceae bacterium]MDP6323736.1 creatininase family protein [Acidimicrobiales bacterium]MDP6893965.1 creatininase family protein [Acidimicrobiales bacterium]